MSDPGPERILLVDDDQRLLDALYRVHRKTYDLHCACGAEAGLTAFREHGPFAVVVADYIMPGMKGSVFLAKVKAISPDTVRMMLTGSVDQQCAVDAVNRGEVLRFLTKPCGDEMFGAALDVAIKQYRLITAERQLLEQTLRGGIQVLAEVLSLTNPLAFGRAVRIRHIVRHVVEKLALPNSWRYESAALLSQIGCVAVPEAVLERAARGERLGEEERRVLDRHPETARMLLHHIPRLEEVAEMIAGQGGGTAGATGAKGDVAQGSDILALAIRFDDMTGRGVTRIAAIDTLRQQKRFDPTMLDALAGVPLLGHDAAISDLPIERLRVGMVIDQDILGNTGTLLVPRGQEVSVGMLERLLNFARLGTIPGSVRVRTPVSAPAVAVTGRS